MTRLSILSSQFQRTRETFPLSSQEAVDRLVDLSKLWPVMAISNLSLVIFPSGRYRREQTLRMGCSRILLSRGRLCTGKQPVDC